MKNFSAVLAVVFAVALGTVASGTVKSTIKTEEISVVEFSQEYIEDLNADLTEETQAEIFSGTAETVTEYEQLYSDEELYLIAHLMYGEYSNSRKDMIQMYVGSVVLNRVEHPDFPNNIYDVIFQNGQYACTWDGNFDREPDEQTWENAEKVLNLFYTEGKTYLDDDVVYQAEFPQGSRIACHIDGIYFCCA